MDRPGNSILGGIGGAALLGLLLVAQPKGSAPTSPTPQTSEVASREPVQARNQAPGDAQITIDNNGPWYALCREYAGSDFETGLNDKARAAKTRGVRKITSPEYVNDDTTEITRKVTVTDDQKDGQTAHEKAREEEHTIPVSRRFVGDLGSCVQGGSSELRVLIATVPDPVNSHMELEFDRVIEALQHAAASSGYSFERYWFPWVSRASSSLSDSARSKAREQQPGLLIFRKLPEPGAGGNSRTGQREGEKLLIFLVGETPTFGLNRTAFAQALWYRHQLSPFIQNPQIAIVGPQFSATYASLRDVLTNRESNPVYGQTLQIISPTTSGASLIKSFRTALMMSGFSFSFASLELPYDDALTLLINKLEKFGYSNDEVAILGEDESAYGNVVNTLDLSSSANHNEVLRLQYPRELSSLRNAMEAEPSPNPTDATAIVPNNSLPLSLHEATNSERDSPPTFAMDQHAADTDRALQEIVRRLRFKRIQAVILVTTNPLDRIYLLDYLHRTLPDIRLAVFDPDQFMLGRPKFVDLSGTLTVSGLPLLSDNMVYLPNARSGEAINFPSTRAEGEYLATATLLTTPNWYFNPDVTTKPAAMAGTLESNDPCAAITIIGKNGFQVAPHDNSRQQYPCALRDRTAFLWKGWAELPWIWTVTETVLFLSVLIHCIFLMYGRTSNPKYLPCAYRVVKGSKTGQLKSVYLLVVGNQLLLFEFLVVTTSYSFNEISYSALQQVLFISHCVMLILIFLANLLTSIEIWSAQTDRWSERWWFLRTMLVLAWFYVLSTADVWVRMLSDGKFWNPDSSIAIRSARLLDGLSPLAPMFVMLFGYVLWGLTQLSRLSQIESRRVDLKIPKELNKSAAALESLENKLHTSIESVWEPRVSMLAIPLVAMIMFFLFRLAPSLRGVDVTYFRWWLIAWGFGGFLITVGSAFYRAWQIWRETLLLLRFLDGTPLRNAFLRIPKELSTMKIWSMGGGRKSFLLQMRTIEILDRIEREEPKALAATVSGGPGPAGIAASATLTGSSEPPHVCKNPLDEARESLLTLIELDSERKIPTPEQIDCLSEKLDCRMRDAACLFHHENLLPKNDPQRKPTQLLELYAAYRFLSLIRYSMLQLRNLVLFSIYGYACLVICISVYPFQGRRALGNLLTLVFLLLLGGISAILIQMDRDGILSRLENTEAGKVSLFSVGSRLLSVGGVPLLAVVASQFPALAEFLASWVKPVIESAH